MTKCLVRGQTWLNVRAAAELTGQIMGQVKTGDYVNAIEYKNGWAKVEMEAGGAAILIGEQEMTPLYGWMYASELFLDDGTSYAAANTPKVPPVDPPPPPPIVIPSGEWTETYWNNTTLSGQPVFTRKSQAINYDWKLGSPNPAVKIDLFSARFERQVAYPAGWRQWTAISDDGVRVRLNGELVIDQWREQPATPWMIKREIPAGIYTETVEYFEQGGQATCRFSSVVSDPPAAPPPATLTYRRGMGLHLMYGWGKSDTAFNLGCRDVLYLDDWASAQRYADKLGKKSAFDKNSVILFRYYWNHWPSFAEVIAKGHVGEDPRIIVVITNECEGLSGDPVKAIKDHAELDIRVAQYAAERNCTVCVGTFPVGNPDYTNPLVVKAVRDYYAPWWNTFHQMNLAKGHDIWPVWDQHEYMPNPTHAYNDWEGDIFFNDGTASLLADQIGPRHSQRIVTDLVGRNKTPVNRIVVDGDLPQGLMPAAAAGGKLIHMFETDWHETRVVFLPLLCHFDITAGKFVSSETGLDWGGKGGFIGGGQTIQDLLRYARRVKVIWNRPIKDDFGHNQPLDKESSVIFQGGQSAQWDSYSVQQWIEQMGPVFQE